RKHQVDGSIEVIAVLQKKRPLLWKENLKALVDGDLRLIRLDLAEVWIHRGIQHEAIVQNEFRIQPDFRLQLSAFKERIRRIALVDVPEAAQQTVWNQLDIAHARHF